MNQHSTVDAPKQGEAWEQPVLDMLRRLDTAQRVSTMAVGLNYLHGVLPESQRDIGEHVMDFTTELDSEAQQQLVTFLIGERTKAADAEESEPDVEEDGPGKSAERGEEVSLPKLLAAVADGFDTMPEDDLVGLVQIVTAFKKQPDLRADLVAAAQPAEA